ncbi:MAG: Arc family DNA-binding protein [Coriobacteriia bacterium]|nr:Arc family DNA-binding protein [Coriobacteriia bacterium]
MTDFLIRDIDPQVLEQLRSRAEQNGRSLQAEIKRTLKKSVRLNKEESLALLDAFRASIPPSTTDSTEIIREFRDSR